MLYFLPELHGISSYLKSVDDDELLVVEELCCENHIIQADETFVELAQMIMDDNNLQIKYQEHPWRPPISIVNCFIISRT